MGSSTGMPGTLTDVLACTLDGVVSDAKIWVPMLSVVEFVKLPASPEEATTVVVIVGLQASTPSIQVYSNLLLAVELPHFGYQAPPGAQQLTRPDFVNLPHFEHALFAGVTLVMVFLATGHRASHRCSEDPSQVVVEIDP